MINCSAKMESFFWDLNQSKSLKDRKSILYLSQMSSAAVPASTSTSVYKVQLRLVEMSLENPMHRGDIPAHFMLQTELSRLPSSTGITSGISVVTALLIPYLVVSSGTNLSSCAPQLFRTVPGRKIEGCEVLLCLFERISYFLVVVA